MLIECQAHAHSCSRQVVNKLITYILRLYYFTICRLSSLKIFIRIYKKLFKIFMKDLNILVILKYNIIK